MKNNSSMKCTPGHWCPAWWSVLVVLVGLWFVLEDLAVVSKTGLSLWPLVVVLVGLKCVGKAVCPKCE